MYKNTAAEIVVRRLNAYYDTPQLIEEELQTIRYAEEQRNKITLRSMQITGLPAGKGSHSDRTADQAVSSTAQYYDEEIIACQKRIAALRSDRDWCTAALASLSRVDRRLVELAYLGPKDPQEREKWLQRPTWYAIGLELGCSESHARTQGSRIIFRLSEHVDQIPMRF